MSIFEYQQGDHPGQYQGFRIVRSVSGDRRQRYIPYPREGQYCSSTEKDRLKTEAEVLDARWRKDQAKHQQQARAAARRNRGENSPFNTSVRGIAATFRCERKKRAGTVRVYYYAIFRVQGQHEGRAFHRDFRIGRLGYDSAWAQAVAFYARNKGLRQWAHLRRRRREPEIFARVRDCLAVNGHDIPADCLPNAEGG